jgi:tetratricopeptide (TPR) repeat protein
VITFAAAAGMLLPCGFSQTRPPTTGTGTTPGTGSTTGNTTGRPPTTPTTTPGTTSGTTQRPSTLFITGRVTLEDGTAPPDTATIERVCSGSVRAEGYTDSKGYFSIEVGNETTVFQDASETANYNPAGPGGSPAGMAGPPGGGSRGGMSSEMRYAMCDLRARLVGYRSQVVSLANRRPLDDPNIGIILLHREGQDEGSTVSAISLAAPRDARRAFEHGLQLLKKNKTDEAEKEYLKAVQIYPKYASAWNELGRIRMGRGEDQSARQAFHTAMEADPKYVNPYLQLSILSMKSQNWPELADVTAHALKLDPFDYPQAYLFNGVANWNLKDVDAAEKSVRQAEKLDTQHALPQINHLMGLILIHHKDYAGGAEYIRRYLKMAPDAEDVEKAKVQLALAEKLAAQGSATAAAKQDQ